MRGATSPRARADGRAALGQDAALRITQAAEQLLAVIANIAVVHLLLGLHRRRKFLLRLVLALGLRRRGRLIVVRGLLLREALLRQVRRRQRERIAVASAATDGERLVCLGEVRVEALETVRLTACQRARPNRLFPIREEGAFLVADAAEKLLVHQAGPWLVRARAVAGDVIAGAHHRQANLPLLIQRRAWMLGATGPGARADRGYAGSEQGALPVTESPVELLVRVANVAVM
mmetsp:Transcript_12703/g.36500  ORF Transcript_12703/g.36500 Transcript_12703/m.36500 type:complete len:233 (+) Transcript_12703:710-1408(+)